jgi:GR25 family glycosyltransferase involved in LPS biosynthesis
MFILNMKHYWINIDKYVDRQEYMSKQFQNNNIENTRVSAFTPSDFDKYLNHEGVITCKYPGCTTCEYEFACLMSHIKAMQMGLESGDDNFVIMEDDIHMPFLIDYENMVKDMPEDTEILQMLILYGPTVLKLSELYQKTKIKHLKWKYLLPSTGMYIITRKGAQKIVDLFYKDEKYDFRNSPYQIVADVLLYETAITYATTLPYAYPNSVLGSSIHPDHIPAHEKTIIDIKKVIDTEIPYVIKRL